jgi:DNA-binding response OmpR family regulator
MGTMRILIMEDDQKAARVLANGLREEGFVVDIAPNGEVGDAMARRHSYEAIVLDWLLPDTSGILVCRDLRASGISTPIVLISARGSVKDRVTGLNTGADDYLTKPFTFEELLARLRALVRRSPMTRQTVLRAADLTLDPVSHRVTRSGNRINLTRTEYAILAVLMRHVEEVVSRTRLMESVWGTPPDSRSVLDVHVSHLRRKIDVAGTVLLIHTIRGSGYLVGRQGYPRASGDTPRQGRRPSPVGPSSASDQTRPQDPGASKGRSNITGTGMGGTACIPDEPPDVCARPTSVGTASRVAHMRDHVHDVTWYI